MPRGFVWCVYTDDFNNQYALRVDADYAQMTERGWAAIDPATTAQFPRGWRPRAVFGHDDSGRRQYAIVASLDADLWVGTTQTFTVEANDNTMVEVQVIGKLKERRLPTTRD